MGCLSYKLTQVGGMTASLTEASCGMTASLSPYEGGMTISFVRKDGGISTSFQRIGGMTCRMGLVCKPGIRKPYLEIEPKVIWVYPDWSAYNDVYSNTHWNVD